jgi:hypothetical protein
MLIFMTVWAATEVQKPATSVIPISNLESLMEVLKVL